MASAAAYKRLTKEYLAIQKAPIPLIITKPLESNILEWYYVLSGPPDTPYHGGQYFGTLRFPPEFPFAPPSIRMITPSGRFVPNSRICLSMSDFHPSTWNPGWSVSTILMGLSSFMVQDESAAGTISTTDDEKKSHARKSWFWNHSNPKFKEVFPELAVSPPKVPPELAEIPKKSTTNESLTNPENAQTSRVGVGQGDASTSFVSIRLQEILSLLPSISKFSKRLVTSLILLWLYLVITRVLVRLRISDLVADTTSPEL